MAPKPSVTSSSTQTKRLRQSNHNRVEQVMENRIRMPPIVGVPFFGKWLCMAYARTGWPIFKASRRRINHGAASSPMASAVKAASTARSVKY